MFWRHPHPDFWIFTDRRTPQVVYYKIHRSSLGYEVSRWVPPYTGAQPVELFEPRLPTLERAQQAVADYLDRGASLAHLPARDPQSPGRGAHRMSLIARRFSCLREAGAPLEPWDPERLARWTEARLHGSPEFWAGRFVMAVWSGRGTDFNLIDAMLVWKASDREAAIVWLRDPGGE